MNTKFLVNAFFVALIGLVACSSSSNVATDGKKQTKNTEQNAVASTYQDSVEAKFDFISGLYAYETGDYERALDAFSSALIKLPNSPGIAYSLSDAYTATNDLANALYYIKEAVKLDPQNSWYWVRLTDVYERSGNIAEAIESVEKLIQLEPAKVDHRYRLADLYEKNNELQQANNVYASVMKKFGEAGPIHYRRYVNFAKMGATDSAKMVLEYLIAKNEEDISLKYTLAELYVNTGDDQKARELLSDIVAKHPTELQALNLLLILRISENEWSSIQQDFDSLVENESLSLVAKEQGARILLSKLAELMQNQSDSTTDVAIDEISAITQQYLQTFSIQSKQEAVPKLLLAQFYLMKNDDSKAKEVLEVIIANHEQESQAWIELIQLYLRTSEMENIIQIGSKADEVNPDNAFIQYAVGVAHYSRKEYKQTVKWLKKATLSPSRREFKSIIYTILGDTYHEIDNWPESANSYDAAIKADPQNATALNNYAYYLSLRNEKINEAKLMSRKSLDIEPENPSFLDTYGWILYQLGEYEEAKTFILKAIDVGGASPEVYEHLGDIYLKLGNETQAIKWWKVAYDLDPQRTYLPERFKDAN